MSITLYCRFANGSEKTVAGEEGRSLLAVLQEAEIDIEGACEGSLACATCHVVVDPAWYGRLPAVKPDETAMLELVRGLSSTSRLSCQIKLTIDMDGLVLFLPD